MAKKPIAKPEIKPLPTLADIKPPADYAPVVDNTQQDVERLSPDDVIIPTNDEILILRELEHHLEQAFVALARASGNAYRAEHVINCLAEDTLAHRAIFIKQGVVPITQHDLPDFNEYWAEYLEHAKAMEEALNEAESEEDE